VRKVFSFVDSSSSVAGFGAGLIVFALMWVVVYEVACRYIFQQPTTWSFEVSEYMLAACVFLAAARTHLVDGHVRVDIVLSRLGRRTQSILNICTSILAFVYVAILTWESWDVAWRTFQGGWVSATPIMLPLFPAKVLIPVGGLLLCLQIASKVWGYAGSLSAQGEAKA